MEQDRPDEGAPEDGHVHAGDAPPSNGEEEAIAPEEQSDDNSDSDSEEDMAAAFPAVERVPGHGCEHYARHALLKSPCCGVFVPCRLCHDDRPGACKVDFDRHSVATVRCQFCDTEQPAQQTCDSCHRQMGRYFCRVCCLYDDQDKGQYHCEGCGICRVGGRDNYKHCDRCVACYGMATYDSHRCIERALDGQCPVCLETMRETREPIHVPPCGHFLHRECFKSLVKSTYACPTCNKSLFDLSYYNDRMDLEIAQTPMPPEYRDWIVGILCNECQQKNSVSFHVIGHKCPNCGSYNTTITDGPRAPGGGEEAEGSDGHAEGDGDGAGGGPREEDNDGNNGDESDDEDWESFEEDDNAAES